MKDGSTNASLPLHKKVGMRLQKKITADGQIPDICIGTSVEEDISYYFNRPKELNDTHGLGAFLMAGAEMIRAKDKLVDLSKRR
jgi:unsaturated rhamnogalacturonyl hydrolase